MKSLSSLVLFLQECEAARIAGVQRALQFLPSTRTESTAAFVAPPNREYRFSNIVPFLESVIDASTAHKFRYTVFDWPFEHFWGNPSEPRHSKLLGYFINPKRHKSGAILLEKLMDVLANAGALPIGWCRLLDGCVVAVESDRIDILITRESPDGKYAIIIENKIHGAVDQDRQLERYVSRLRQNGFEEAPIHTLYLPLTGGRNSPETAALKLLGVECRTITFEQHILGWLDSVLQPPPTERSDYLPDELRQHLIQYRSLITYLINKNQEVHMNYEILRKLETTPADEMPSWQQVKELQEHIQTLQQCLQRLLRGRLFMAVKNELANRGLDSWLCFEREPQRGFSDFSLYSNRLAENLDLCVRIDESVSACIGGNDSSFWEAYIKTPSKPTTRELQLIEDEIESRRKIQDGKRGDPYYFWWNYPIDYAYVDKPETVKACADRLQDLHTTLARRFGDPSQVIAAM